MAPTWIQSDQSEDLWLTPIGVSAAHAPSTSTRPPITSQQPASACRHFDYRLGPLQIAPRNQPAIQRVFPYGQPRTRRSPCLHHLRISPRCGGEPFEHIENESVAH